MTENGDERASASVGDVLLIAVCFALVTGVSEAVTKTFRIFVLHHIIGVNQDFPWMAPLAYALFYVPIALLLMVVLRIVRREPRYSVFVGIFAFLAIFALLLPYTELATIAEAFVAAGIAVQAHRLAKANPTRARRRVRRITVALAVLVVGVGVGETAWRLIAARNGVSSLPPYRKGRPNVLLIIFDTVRRANVSLYGYSPPTTPEIERWARTGVVFDQAIAPAPWTLPTHASMFTGRRPGVLSVDWLYPLPDNGPPTVAEVLRDNGYLTAGFVSNHFYTSYESGLERGFTLYDDYRTSLRLILANSAYGRSDFFNQILEHRTLRGVASAVRHLDFRRAIRPSHVPRLAPQVTAAFLDWQKESGERPFFAFLNYMGAHRPYRSDPTWVEKFKSTPGRKTDEYDAAIARLDHEVGRILDTLERRGVLKNTLVIFAADHGEHFGEHGLVEHGNSLYRELLEVPLAMSLPSRIPAGQRVGALVSLRDLGATILDVTGNADARFPGASLAQYWSATPPTARGSILSELTKGVNVDKNFRNSRGGLQSLIDSRFHYIHNDVGDEELYERGADSAEARNLAKDPAMRLEMERFRRELAAARADAP